MANATDELVSIGGLAERTGRSPSTLKFWERAGVIPPGIRVAGDNRRVWRASEVEAIRRRIEERENGRRKPAEE